MAEAVADLDAVLLSVGNYAGIRSTYWSEVYSAVFDYLTSADKPITSYKARVKRAIGTAAVDAAETAWLDGGAELPLDEDASQFLETFQQSEMSNADNLFATLKQLKREADSDEEAEANNRANGYAAGLDGMYSQVKVMGMGNQMLTLAGEDGQPPKFPCPECRRLKGQRHRAKWWIAHDLVPRRGNDNYTCGGWQCRHYLEDDEGNMVTL